MPKIMTSEDVADYLRTNVETIRRRARAGRLPAAKLGRNWRFRKADLDEWLATGGSEYEDLVEEGLAAVTEERKVAERRRIPLADVKARGPDGGGQGTGRGQGTGDPKNVSDTFSRRRKIVSDTIFRTSG